MRRCSSRQPQRYYQTKSSQAREVGRQCPTSWHNYAEPLDLKLDPAECLRGGAQTGCRAQLSRSGSRSLLLLLCPLADTLTVALAFALEAPTRAPTPTPLLGRLSPPFPRPPAHALPRGLCETSPT
eukprot:6027122-Pleurochrysis_carterae.AAC.1